MISDLTGAKIDFVPNPRREDDENDLLVTADRFLSLGLAPITLADGLLEEIRTVAQRYAHRCNRARIPCVSAWNADAARRIVKSSGPGAAS